MGDPQAVIPLVEERAPETERQASNDPSARCQVAFTSDAGGCLLDARSGSLVEDRRITEPCRGHRGGGDNEVELGVDDVSQRHLDVMKRLEHCR
jgi:hypothetical protein